MSIAADFNFGKHMQNSFLLMRMKWDSGEAIAV